MNANVVVAAMGFVSTFLGAWWAADCQRRGTREVRILDVRVREVGPHALNELLINGA
jgi:hypothetical protein